jgi:ABC-type transport system involved in Fe-S cluster assembly fused permease/ATPase subunit
MNSFGKQYLRILQNVIKNQNLSYHLDRNYCFKSAISLETLYPGSKQKLYTPSFVSVNFFYKHL